MSLRRDTYTHTLQTNYKSTNYKSTNYKSTNMLSLSPKHPAIERIGPCKYEVCNIDKVESFTNELKPLICCKYDINMSEIMFTQWSESPQNFPKIEHDGCTLGQRARFDAYLIYKQDGEFYLQVANNWFVKYDGPNTLGVETDYEIRKRIITKELAKSLEYNRRYLRARERLNPRAKTLSKPRAKTLPKPRAKTLSKPRKPRKPRINRGKRLVEIALGKCNKKNVNRKKR